MIHPFSQKILQRLKRFHTCAMSASWMPVLQAYQPIITPLARSCNRQPCPMRNEPERGLYFQPGMSLKRQD